MEKIKEKRDIQSMAFDDFFNLVTDKCFCEYCDSFEDCCDAIGYDNIQALSGRGCKAFDASVEDIKKYYLIEKCIPIGT